MTGRVLLAACLVFCACKKDKGNASSDPAGGSTATTAGEKRVSDDWKQQTGPGFTVSAPGAASVEKVPAKGGDRAFDRYTFHKSGHESYVVEITELPADADLSMSVDNMRTLIASKTQSVRGEDLIEGGEVTGIDIRYIHDEGDDTLHAHSRLLGKGQRIFHVRAIVTRNKAGEALAAKFVESLTLTP